MEAKKMEMENNAKKENGVTMNTEDKRNLEQAKLLQEIPETIEKEGGLSGDITSKAEAVVMLQNVKALNDPTRCSFNFRVERNPNTGVFTIVVISKENDKWIKTFKFSKLANNPKILNDLKDIGTMDSALFDELIFVLERMKKDYTYKADEELTKNSVYTIYLDNLNNFSADTTKPLTNGQVGYSDNDYNYLSEGILKLILEEEYNFHFTGGKSRDGMIFRNMINNLVINKIISTIGESSNFVHCTYGDKKNATYYRFYKEKN